MKRNLFIKVRVSESEKEQLKSFAVDAGMTLSDLMRNRTLNTRLRQTGNEKELIRQIARIGSNINQIARWANIHKLKTPSLETVLWLNRIYEAVKALKKGE